MGADADIDEVVEGVAIGNPILSSAGEVVARSKAAPYGGEMETRTAPSLSQGDLLVWRPVASSDRNPQNVG